MLFARLVPIYRYLFVMRLGTAIIYTASLVQSLNVACFGFRSHRKQIISKFASASCVIALVCANNFDLVYQSGVLCADMSSLRSYKQGYNSFNALAATMLQRVRKELELQDMLLSVDDGHTHRLAIAASSLSRCSA